MCIHRKENNHVFTDFLLRFFQCFRISPTDPSERTDLRLYQMFFVWFTSNFNILAFSTGSAAPAFFGMDIKHCVAIFIVVDTMWVAYHDHHTYIYYMYFSGLISVLVGPSQPAVYFLILPEADPCLSSCDHATLITYFIRREIFPNGGPLYSYISNEPKCRSFTCAAVY